MASILRLASLVLILVLDTSLAGYDYDNLEPKDESLLNTRKNEPLPKCRWEYKYDIPKAVVAGVCFAAATFVLFFGKPYRCKLEIFFILGDSTLSRGEPLYSGAPSNTKATIVF